MSSFFYENDIAEIVAGLKAEAESFEGKTVLITGGAGFLGQYFAAVLANMNETMLKKPCKIIAFDNFITSEYKSVAEQPKNPHVTLIQHDVIHPVNYNEPVDYILHAAGIASPYYYRAFPLQTLDVAIVGTRNMLELARQKNAKILFFSSSEIYGDPDARSVPTKETYRGNVSCLGPRACYDESKRLGETLCKIYFTEFGTQTRMVRPFNVFGPGMKEKDYRVLPNFASRIVAGRPLGVYGDGTQTRTFCYITDAIVGFLKVLVNGKAGEPYNIGNPTPEISMLQLVQTIEKVLGKKIELEITDYPSSYPADEPQRRCPDITRAKTELNYSPRVDFADGLNRYMKWAMASYKGEL
jgi:UDP-glucuronate decarboxylase